VYNFFNVLIIYQDSVFIKWFFNLKPNHMSKILSVLISLLVAAAFFAGSDEVFNQADVEIQEWQVPWEESRPRDPFVAPDEDIWFVGQRTDYVAEFNPETEEFRRIDLDDGAGPHTVVVDAQGNPWYAGNRANHIGKINPETGEITKYMMPDDNSARDPHTMTFDERGNIWFTSQGANSIGYFDVESEEETIIPVQNPRSRPYEIILDQDMTTPWIVLFGTNKLATVNSSTMELKEIELPNEDTRPRRLAQTSDGVI